MKDLHRAGLIDRIFLLIFPVVLGSGKRLFGSGTVPVALVEALEEGRVRPGALLPLRRRPGA